LQSFAFERFKKIWGSKFQELPRKVLDLKNNDDSVTVFTDVDTLEFDYVIDCRGFPTDYTEYHLSDCSPVNRCFVHSIDPHIKTPFSYTEHIATKHGWTFGIPLTTRHTYGYLFNDTISSEQQVLEDMSNMFNTKLNKTDVIDYKFKSYYTKKLLDNRILKNGNRALFFEPLSASSIYLYVEICELFLHHLNKNSKYNESFVNISFKGLANSLEDMLSFLYHGGSTFDTEFWKYAKDKGNTRIKNSKTFPLLVNQYKAMTANGTPLTGDQWFFTPGNLRIIDEHMNYNYFKNYENTN
jgi:tryptophan halogenase